MSDKSAKQRIEELAHKYKNGTISEAELEEFDLWYNASKDEQFVHSQADDPEIVKLRIFAPLAKSMRDSKKSTGLIVPLFRRYAVAASLVLILAIGGGLYFNRFSRSDMETIVYKNDVKPGRNGATLILANGKRIRLNDVKEGELVSENGVKIIKTAKGKLIYELDDSSSKAGGVNTLATANGETYALRLPDGSQVWLNAASSLTYGSTLNENGQRVVSLEGEAYFEIAKDREHPFIVHCTGQEVKVLGTHFNIQAYSDEGEIKTTLLEGSVNVRSDKTQATLKPGQQSVFSPRNFEVQQADVEAAVGWKDGAFIFKEQRITEIMKTVARWYNVKVVFQENFNDRETFSGQVSRSSQISQILKSLQSTGKVEFSIEGNLVSVTN